MTTRLFCGKCRVFMVGESGTSRSKEVHHYCKCAKAKKHACDKKTVRKEWIEDFAVRKALKILNDEKMTSYLVDKIYSLQSEDNPRLPWLKEQLAETEKKIENILNVIEQGAMLSSVQKRLSELEERKNDVELAILQEKIKKPFFTKEQIAYAFEKFKKLNISTRESKQKFIDCFINAIYPYDDKVTFIFNFKNVTQTVSLTELSCSDYNCLGAPKKGANLDTMSMKIGICSYK